jgi:glycosyltransferase involved in cell wall biosynthesis
MLRESDVLLLPSNREGLPVAMMEALGAGCAVVASRVSGVEDYESHLFAKGSLWVHDVGDANRAAELVAQALAVPRAHRIRRARALAEAEFSIERCAERYAELIAHLPATRTPGRALGFFRTRLIGLASAPVAAQRRLRMWAADR